MGENERTITSEGDQCPMDEDDGIWTKKERVSLKQHALRDPVSE